MDEDSLTVTTMKDKIRHLFHNHQGAREIDHRMYYDFQSFDQVESLGYNDNVRDDHPHNVAKHHHISVRIKYHDFADLNLIVLLWFKLCQYYYAPNAVFFVNLSVLVGVSLNFMAKVLRRSFPDHNHFILRAFYVFIGTYVLLADTISNAYFTVFHADHAVLNATQLNSGVNATVHYRGDKFNLTDQG